MAEATDLVRKYLRSGLLLDTNLLVVWIVGSVDRNLVGKNKSTRKYDPDDFAMLEALFQKAHRIVTTPHILAEANGIAMQSLNKAKKEAASREFANFIASAKEAVIPSKNALTCHAFGRLGLVDCCILKSPATAMGLIITDDRPLFLELQRLDVDAVNWNHLRMVGWE